MTETKVAIPLPITPAADKWTPTAQGSQSDSGLATKVMQALSADQRLGKGDIRHIHVTVNRGGATITGHVMRALSKGQAETTARATQGVSTVINHLAADDELTIQVAQALGNDPQTRSEQIQVNVQHGVVYLGGTVKRAPVRVVAVQIAANVPQGRGVINVIQTPGITIDADEEHFVQPGIESEIYATDRQIGRVQQVVINPQNRRVTAVVVNTLSSTANQQAQPVLIPLGSIRCAPSGALFLKINGGATAHFANFNPTDFDRPATDWQPPYPYTPANVLLQRDRS